MAAKILLVVEGQTAEPRILGSNTHGLLSLIGADYEIFQFSCAIYELYEDYKKGLYNNLVAYLRAEKGLQLPSGVLSKNAFSAVYLFFDFEPQYQKYSDKDIHDLQEIFNDETDLGKLYINYPMVEAFYHFNSLPDPDFAARTVSRLARYIRRPSIRSSVSRRTTYPQLSSAILFRLTIRRPR